MEPAIARARMWIALGLLVVFCGLAVKTMDPGKVRTVVLLLLGFFAVRIVLTAVRFAIAWQVDF